MSRLNGKVALISGGARGIGAAVGLAMVAEGAKVILGDILDTEGQSQAKAIGSNASYVHLDVTMSKDWESAVEATIKTYGKLNVLVNNAGVAVVGTIDEFSQDDWDKVIGVDLTGVFKGIKAAIPTLKNAEGGSIINISSIAGIRGFPALSAYVAAKFGVCGLTKSAALDLAKYGIRVNSVHPGFIRTPMTAGAQQPTSHVAMNRPGDPAEIARLVVFLASDESSFSTGAEFIADGGESAGFIVDATT